MRNTVQRRNHRERGQPLEREKWGVLEKHKDYSLRARDYEEKRARLKILRQKAAERNPDEFNYGMLKSKTNKGKKLADRGNATLGPDVVRLLKTQDIGYLQCTLQKTQRAIQRLQHEFVLVEGAGVDVLGEPKEVGRGQHVVLVQDGQAQKRYDPLLTAECNVEQERYLLHEKDQEHEVADGEDAFVKRKTRRQTEREALIAIEEKVFRKMYRQGQEAQKRKLATLRVREKDLGNAMDEVQHQRAKMSNSVGGVTKKGLKWKTRERKS